MITRTLGQIAAMIPNAAVQPQWEALRISGISKDTRAELADTLYVPIAGERYDGHHYAPEAIARGAAASLWQRDRGPGPAGVPVVEVDDTLSALQQLAAAYRKQLAVKVIAITGSNGKTSTKDLVSAAMGTVHRVHKTQGNLNNHIGLPMTLLELDEQTEIAVLEMGMSDFGEIALLSAIAEPDCAIITNIGESHMQQLGSRAGIAKAKFEIIAGLKPGGVLIYYGEEPLLARLVDESDAGRSFELIRFGASGSDDYCAADIDVSLKRTAFTAVRSAGGERIPLSIPLLGRHNVINALAAVAAAIRFGVPAERIRDGLAAMKPTSMRIEAVASRSGATLLNDAYNASPASMRAALGLLAELTVGGRKLAVLGDMLELGPDAERFHREIGRSLGPDMLSRVYTYGEAAAYIAEECRERFAPGQVQAFRDKALLIEQLARELQPDDVCLFKASRGMKLEEAVEALSQI